MKVIELYERLSEIIPASLSCTWDRDGLESCPEPDRDVRKILVSLDVTNSVIDRAIETRADVIVSHHPLFFGGLGNINAMTFDGARAVKLAREGIAVMSFHTRLDALKGGVNDTLASLMGLCDVKIIGDEGIARIGELECEMSVEDFGRMLKERLSSGSCEREAHIAVCGANRAVKKVALLGGSGGDDIKVAAASGADTYVTGELKYHERLSAVDFNMNLICAGHFFTEYPVCEFLKETVMGICPDAEVEIYFSNTIIEF